MKVIINTCYGGYGLSGECIARVAMLKGEEPGEDTRRQWIHDRFDIDVIRVVEEMGMSANTRYSELSVYTFPEYIDPSWITIGEYDGLETVIVDWPKALMNIVEQHRYDPNRDDHINKLLECRDYYLSGNKHMR